MAATPSSKAKTIQSPNKTPTNIYRKWYLSPSSTSLTPQTPETLTPLRRSSRHVSRKIDLGNDPTDLPGRESIQEINLTPRKRTTDVVAETLTTPNKKKKKKKKKKIAEEASFSPTSPNRSETITKKKNRVYYNKVEFNVTEFEIGDHVYVKRREDTNSDEEEEDPEIEDCQMCFKSDTNIMIECDDCLGGFHLNCLKPPLKDVPKGDWICQFCVINKPPQPQGKKKAARTMREKLLFGDLWAARIEKLMMMVVVCIGLELVGIVMSSVLWSFRKRVMMVMMCFYVSMNMMCIGHSFKRLVESADEDSDSDQEWNGGKEEEIDDSDDEEESVCADSKSKRGLTCANVRKGRIFGLEKVGTKRIPEHVRFHKKNELEKAKATLLLATSPKSLPCRSKEMEEITAFIKGSILDDQCLGRCMYIHGVPGTGKTITVLSVMKNLKAEVEAGSVSPYCFVEINGLKLASPENIYSFIYEALSGHRVSWKKALQSLNERFAEGKRIGKENEKPCILLIDELDLLVTRNQSVLYNILDWPTKPNSRLVVLGIANTMDLPEKVLPRISSQMGIQRLCFGPYNHMQLQEIISTRLKGINAFEKTAIEFASRKVAAVSGDARRALEICRRAAEVAEYRLKKTNKTAKSQLVIMADVEAAIQEMFQAPHIQVMKSV
ncbi:unnamed protein product [Arabidopsis lyrata]|nr:unnamed protein product [Arabidopsis lyrata]